MNRWLPLVGLVFMTLSVASCVGAAPASPSSQTAAAPTAPAGSTPASDIAGCFSGTLSGSHGDRSLEAVAKLTPTAVVGTFAGFGTAFWDTPGARSPTREEARRGDAYILTPVRIAVDGVAKGRGEVAERAVVMGGTVGCYDVKDAEPLDLKAGQRYVFFLLPQTKGGNEKRPTGNAWVVEAWPVGSDGSVKTPQDGVRPLALLVTEIQAGKPTWTLAPDLPEPTGGP